MGSRSIILVSSDTKVLGDSMSFVIMNSRASVAAGEGIRPPVGLLELLGLLEDIMSTLLSGENTVEVSSMLLVLLVVLKSSGF